MQPASQYLYQALTLAELRRGFCAPNPAVGAVVVKDGQVLATGYHRASGQPHAEAEALASLGEAARGAALYVTLEPCCHTAKKTPPCTQLIIERGIAEVYYAYTDPNPQVAGRGAEQLQAAGITCTHVPLAAINTFYQSYSYWQRTGRPWVTAKLALSLDGKIAGSQGKPAAITGSEAQRYTHTRRRQADALLTTAATVVSDDPQLNVRLDKEVIAKPLYILDRDLRLPLTAKIWQTAQAIYLLHKPAVDTQRREALQQRGAQCIAITDTAAGLFLPDVLNYIGKQGVHDLWLETGGRCFQAFTAAGLVQRALLYIAPKVLGEQASAAFSSVQDFLQTASQINWRQLGQDAMCELVWGEINV